jgi:hypothetical protein
MSRKVARGGGGGGDFRRRISKKVRETRQIEPTSVHSFDLQLTIALIEILSVSFQH